MPSHYTSNTIERDIFASDETVPGHGTGKPGPALTPALWRRKAGVSTFANNQGGAGRRKPLLLGSRLGLLT